MEENINSRDSLRANGVFVSPSMKLSELECTISEFKNIPELCNEISQQANKVYDEFLNSIDMNLEIFNDRVLNSTNYFRDKLLKMIAHIQNKDFHTAFLLSSEELFNGKRGGFQNNGKYIKEYTPKMN